MTGSIRVVCRDCDLDRVWSPSDGRLDRAPRHKHDLVTDHAVGYEAADEEARR
ncbi:MAG: hypothetical protein ACI8XM_000220 [Haloarculaceae archaeon]|jgi:hypothetical protein